MMAMRLALLYIPYATSSREQTGNTITFTQFEEGDLLSGTRDLLSKTRDNTEISNKYDDDSTLLPLISEEEIDVMSSGDESDAELMSTDILEDIRGGNQSYPIITRR